MRRRLNVLVIQVTRNEVPVVTNTTQTENGVLYGVLQNRATNKFGPYKNLYARQRRHLRISEQTGEAFMAERGKKN